MRRMLQGLRRFHRDDRGATAIEYGLIAAVIAVGIILAMTAFGSSLSSMFNDVASRSANAMAG